MPRSSTSCHGLDFETTPIIALENRRIQFEREGRDIVNFAGGQADVPTPENIVEAAVKALRDGYTRYTEDAGLLELREALCEKLARENALHYYPEDVDNFCRLLRQELDQEVDVISETVAEIPRTDRQKKSLVVSHIDSP